MKLTKYYWFVALLLSLVSHRLPAGEFPTQTKMNPELRLFRDVSQHPMGLTPLRRELKKINQLTKFPVLIKFAGPADELKQLGAAVQAQIGDIYSAHVRQHDLQTLTQNKQVQFIQGEIYHHPLNDLSVKAIYADQARLQYQVSGQGVLIGIIDSGIDWRHADFRNSNGATRIKYLLDFSFPGDLNGDFIPDGPDAYGGTLFSEAEINRALQGLQSIQSQDELGHGTHVTGTAAGNGLGTGGTIPAGTYAGVALAADLIIVKATQGMGYQAVDLVNSMAFIDSLANVLGQPYVLNLSLGGDAGPHDGTSLEEIAIDNLCGAGKPGKAVVVAAGNNGDEKIHAQGELSTTLSSMTIDFKIPAYTPQAGTQNDYVLFHIWYTGSARMTVSLKTPGNRTFGPVGINGQIGENTSEGAIYIENSIGGVNALNGDRQILLQIYDTTEKNVPANGAWKITLSGTAGQFHLWMYGNECQAEITLNATQSHLVTIPGTAENAITVAAFTSKSNWIDFYGQGWQYPWIKGSLATFSSPGPTRDGRLKPDLAAPGQEIVSTYSAAASPGNPNSVFAPPAGFQPNILIMQDNQHGLLHGTSMATPHVTGAVALMLEKNPNLDAAQIKEILLNSADADQYTGAVPNYKSGYGKLNVLSALNKISATLQFPAPQQLKAVEIDSGIKLTWLPPRSSTVGMAQPPAAIIQNTTPHSDQQITIPGEPVPLRSYPQDRAVTAAPTGNLANLTGYQVFRSTDPLQAFTRIANLGKVQEFLDRQVTIGQRYWYYLVAQYENPTGLSSPSVKVSIVRGESEDLPLVIQYDNGKPGVYGKLLRGSIQALKFDLDQAFDEYYLNSVSIFYLNYQQVRPTGTCQIRVNVYPVSSQGVIGTLLTQTPVKTLNQSVTAPNWTEIDLRALQLKRAQNEAVLIGIEWVGGDSSTLVMDSRQNIDRNRAYYFVRNRWEEHYSFWPNAQNIGYPMLRAVFTSKSNAENPLPVPETYTLTQNYPNPFHQATAFSWFIPEAAQVQVAIYDILGREVINLIQGRFEKSAQAQKITWNGVNSRGELVPSGIYFAMLKTEKVKLTRKLIFLRGKTSAN